MTYHLALKKPCSRCARIEETVVSVEEAVKVLNSKPEEPAVSARFRPNLAGAVHVGYAHEQLCSVCSGIVERYLELAFRRIDKVSATRTGAKPDEVLEVEAE